MGLMRWASSLALLILFIGLAWLTQLEPTANENVAVWLEFLGGLHPPVVHLPLGLWAGAVLILLAGTVDRRRVMQPWLSGASLAVLAGALGAFATGLLLRISGTYSKVIVSHMNASLVFLALLFWFTGLVRKGVGMKKLWCGAVVVSGSLGYAAHLGGVISHGDVFDGAPWVVQAQMKAAPSVAGELETTVFKAAVLPILEEKCIACHAGQRAPANLMMTSEAAILKGGVSGAAIKPGAASESLMMQRMKLPPDHPLHMPPAKPYVTDGEQRFLTWWMERGVNAPVSSIPDAFSAFVQPDDI